MSSARAIVAGHGSFADGMISAVMQISGRGDVFVALSNRDLSAQDVERVLRAHLDQMGATVVFTDLPAGSCTMAARRLQRERPGLVLVTGVNLATLLDFVFQEALPSAEAAGHAAEKGRAALLLVPGEGPRVALELYRIDDRLIHGQVVVGWGQPLDLRFIVLVDDEVAGSEWEQELYRLGVPPEMDVNFNSVDDAGAQLEAYLQDPRRGLLLTGDIDTMARLIDTTGGAVIRRVNLGGIHHRQGRIQRLRYVFLSPEEEAVLKSIAARGIEVSAQDVPAARPLSLDEVLSGEGNR